MAEHFRGVLEDPSTAPVPFRWPAENATDVLNPADLVDLKSPEWKWDVHKITDLRNLAELTLPEIATCDCRFCASHEQIHPRQPVTLANGASVVIDRGVAGVMAAFGADGIITSGSCEDFGPALRALDRTAFHTLRDDRAGAVNYARPLTEGGAFVRFSAGTEVGKSVATQLGKQYGMDQYGSVTQVTFPLAEAWRVRSIIQVAAERIASR